MIEFLVLFISCSGTSSITAYSKSSLSDWVNSLPTTVYQRSEKISLLSGLCTLTGVFKKENELKQPTKWSCLCFIVKDIWFIVLSFQYAFIISTIHPTVFFVCCFFFFLKVWPSSFVNEDTMLSSSGHCVFSLLEMSVNGWPAAEWEAIRTGLCVSCVGTLKKNVIRQDKEYSVYLCFHLT